MKALPCHSAARHSAARHSAAAVLIALLVSPGLVDPDDALLDWAGLFPNYQVFRSINPNDVLLNPLVQTPATIFEDPTSDPFTALFYRIEPGP